MATFSYADAVKLLGGTQSRIVTALDKILGGALLAGSGLDLWGLLGWFDAKADFIRLSHELVTKAAERRSGISRYDRTQRLHAAHTVIAVVAFFEAFDELEFPLTSKDLDLTKQRQKRHRFDAPLPVPQQPNEVHLRKLRAWYAMHGSELKRLIKGLAVWDQLDETRQERLDKLLAATLPNRAVRRYEELFRQLAVDFPEVAFWWLSQDGQATRASLGSALQRLERALNEIAIGESPTERRAELARKYQAVLGHPVIEPDQVPVGLAIPTLSECYVDPRFQLCEAGQDTEFARKSLWDDKPVLNDVHEFLVGHLTSPRAAELPLVVLGDPGSGKSMLTKVLAARLPASDFLVLRVELRTTPTEADIREQIEHGLRELLQEDVSWPALTRSASQALAVVLLDGFDELLQATGVSQTDYLEKIARFQRDSLELGRPVAFVVTSRISVADRAVMPAGTAVLRLMPFDSAQIELWLDVWNSANASTELDPLSAQTVSRYPDLSEQPLLLLMLALYDADGNALQRGGREISQAELYEKLLTRFARREVVKDGKHRGETELAAAVEEELERLSIVAFAMFNRGAQWVSEQDLDADISALLPGDPVRRGVRAPLGAGETVLGRFFFVQRAQATRDRKTLRTYEFLHATFGEYLVARSAWHILHDLVEAERNRPRRKFAGGIDDSELYALLSFMPLCARGSVISFLAELAKQTDDLDGLFAVLAELFRVVEMPRANQVLADYEPAIQPVPTRYAVYSANLLLLAVIVRKRLSFSDLCADGTDTVSTWRRFAQLWQSQLGTQNWSSLVNLLELHRVWSSAGRDLKLCLNTGFDVPELDFGWLVGEQVRTGRAVLGSITWPRREAHFVCDYFGDIINHAVSPLMELAPRAMGTFTYLPDGAAESSVYSLLALLLSPDQASFRRVESALASDKGVSRIDRMAKAVTDVLRTRPGVFDTRLFTEDSMLTSNLNGWVLLCERLGKTDDDAELVPLLCSMWDAGRAYRHIPEFVLDAWLRMAERGTELEQATPGLLDVLRGVDLPVLARQRPDLIKRAKVILAERGQNWPG